MEKLKEIWAEHKGKILTVAAVVVGIILYKKFSNKTNARRR